MRRKRFIIVCLLLFVTGINCLYSQNKELKELTKKGNNVFVIVNCMHDESYESLFLNKLGGEDLWIIQNNPRNADFILIVNSWYRQQAMGVGCDVYAIIQTPDGGFLWRSDIYFGQPTVFNNYDYKGASIKKIINEGFLKDLKNQYKKERPIIDYTGVTKVDKNKFEESENYFFEGLKAMNQYNNKKALDLIDKSISVNPYNSISYRYKAIVLCNQSKFKDAKKAIMQSMLYDPYSSRNDSIYLAIMIGKNAKFMRNIFTTLAISNYVNETMPPLSQTNMPVNSEIVSDKNHNNVREEICSHCQGSGVNPVPTHSVSFANMSDEYCTVCKKVVVAGHGTHGACPSCGGKGYIQKVKF